MLCETKSDVLRLVKDQNISFIQFWFTDVLGILKSFAVTHPSLKRAWKKEWGLTALPSKVLPESKRAI